MEALYYKAPVTNAGAGGDAGGGIRKKTLSLGLNNITGSPQKPLYHEQNRNSGRGEPKASDFEKYLQHAKKHRNDDPNDDLFGTTPAAEYDVTPEYNPPASYYNAPVGGAGNHNLNNALDLTNYKFNMDEDNYPSGGAYVNDYNKFHKGISSPRDGAVKERVLSLGVTNLKSNPKDLSAAEREDRKKRYTEFQQKLLADQSEPIPQTRQSMVKPREEDDPHYSGTGLRIGAADSEHDRARKRAAQHNYFEQLSNDRHLAEVSGDRKPFVRKNSPEPEPSNNGLYSLGQAQEERNARRAAVEQTLRSRRSEVTQQMESPPRDYSRLAQEGVHFNAAEQQKFENAQYKYIGEYSDPTSARQKKQSMQAHYMAQLLADSNGQQLPRASKGNLMGPYATDSGAGYNSSASASAAALTGAVAPRGPASVSNIGAGESQSAEQKYLRQIAYKRLLDQQRLQAADLARLEEKKYGKM